MNTLPNLLIVEDDQRLAELIKTYLIRSGFDVSTVSDGESAVQRCRDTPPSVIVLDLMLPGIDGISVCRQLRTFYTGRILILTASSNDMDQVVGLEIGADDYVVKPVEPRVLLARVRALMRRSDAIETVDEGSGLLEFGRLTIDDNSKSVMLDKRMVNLTTHEFELLSLLAKSAGVVLTRDDIYTSLRGFGYDGTDRAVDVKISRLRRKLGDDANEPRRIKTVWGKGYLFVSNAWMD